MIKERECCPSQKEQPKLENTKVISKTTGKSQHTLEEILQNPRADKTGRPAGTYKVPREEIIRLREEERLSWAQISEVLDISPSGAWRLYYLKENGKA